MKICTFNIWNSDIDFEKRMSLVASLIKDKKIDILALQEVKNEDVAKQIARASSCEHFSYSKYLDYDGGLAIISKYPIQSTVTNFENTPKHNSGVQRCIITINNMDVGFTNLHLDYQLEENRLMGLDDALDLVENDTKEVEFLLGDFNIDAQSNIHFELKMDNFDDLYQSYCFKRNIFPEPTIDFINNPRWKDKPTDEIPSRFDWIFLNTSNKFVISHAEIIGKDETDGITPSDHYGVLVELEFNK